MYNSVRHKLDILVWKPQAYAAPRILSILMMICGQIFTSKLPIPTTF